MTDLCDEKKAQESDVPIDDSMRIDKENATDVATSWLYRGERNPWVKGSVFFVLIFALPSLFSPSPLCGAILKRKQALNL